MNIGMDLDDCIYDFWSALTAHVIGTGEYKGEPEDYLRTFQQEYDEKKRTYLVSLHFLYDRIPIRPDNLEFINKVSELGNLYYITSRPESTRLVTERWMRNNNLPQRDNLIMSKDKLNYIKLYSVDHFLDDMPFRVKNVENFCNTIMMMKPWNVEYRDKYRTVSSVQEFYNIIKDS